MAKKSKIAKNEQRIRLVEKYRELRKQLKETIRNPSTSDEDKYDAYAKLRSLPRDANPIRIRNRCQFTGRPRGNYRKFGISRVQFREMALRGEIPGVKKASW
ncbi:MAG: 30S ribosomal protein S14 [Planctomycetota bacterium]|nr:30S ribosomal protein S14 [Planctomycetota bacterium]